MKLWTKIYKDMNRTMMNNVFWWVSHASVDSGEVSSVVPTQAAPDGHHADPQHGAAVQDLWHLGNSYLEAV